MKQQSQQDLEKAYGKVREATSLSFGDDGHSTQPFGVLAEPIKKPSRLMRSKKYRKFSPRKPQHEMDRE
jgi:hypothetical protein